MEYRKIKFYALNGRNKDKTFKTRSEIKNFLINIYESCELTDDGHRYKVFSAYKKNYTFEFLEFNDNEMFLRVRQPRPKNHYGKSEDNNATLKKLDIDDNEHMESYTFLYLDFETMIVSHLKIQGTPSINYFISFLMSENGYGDVVKFYCDAIATEDIIKQIVNNQKFGTITYSYVNPSDKALSEIPGVTDSVKKGLQANRSTIEVKISPKRSKNLLKEGSFLYELRDWLVKGHGDNLKKFSINAGEYEDSKMATFNLLNQEFTQETAIKADDEVNEKEYLKAIRMAYHDIKATLVKYVRSI